jgi:sporulation protein YlmC with PRC-barrel domain
MQMEIPMKSLSTIAFTVLLIATPACFAQQVVGSTTLGVAYAELRDVTTGWSTKRQVLGKKVFNDNGETVGKIDDIIVAPDKAVSYAIIGAGGFLGVGRHDVAIPVSQLKEDSGKFILAGASKEAVKAMPEFEYASNH